MQKKLTITIDDAVHRGLHERIGAGGISQLEPEIACRSGVSCGESRVGYGPQHWLMLMSYR